MLKIIEQIFGARVAKIVDGCTDSYVEDPKKKENWEQRKFRYLRRVRHEDAETRFVSAADKLYNVRAVLRDLRYNGDLAFARFSAPKARIIWYYRSLVNEYRAGGVTHLLKPLLDDLDRVVVEVEHLSGLLAASPSPPSPADCQAQEQALDTADSCRGYNRMSDSRSWTCPKPKPNALRNC